MSKSCTIPSDDSAKKLTNISNRKTPITKRTIHKIRLERSLNQDNDSPEKPLSKKIKTNDNVSLIKFSDASQDLTLTKYSNKENIFFNEDSNEQAWSIENALKLLHEEKEKNKFLNNALKKKELNEVKLIEKVRKLESDTKQVSSQKIVSTIERVLGYSKSDKALAEITITNENTPKLITVGRPPVIGESKTQFSHMIPYGLINKLVKSVVENKLTFDDKIELLIEDITSLFSFDEGVCLSSEDLDKYNIPNKLAKKAAYLTYNTTNDTYYLIDEDLEKLIPKSFEKATAQKRYVEKKQKFISAVLTELKNSIHDENTKIIFCKELVNFMFILFNKKTLASYPNEGNNLENEIRLYKSTKSALSLSNDYEIITAFELETLLDKNKSLDNKIRIVNNSGSRVKKALKALKILDDIFDLVLEDQSVNKALNSYNKLNTQVKLVNSNSNLEEFNEDLTDKNINRSIYFHIAKQAFSMFGLTALEKKVFVPATSKTKGIKITKVYPSATGKVSKDYTLMSGEEYRTEQISSPKAKSFKKFGFRPEITNMEFLAKKAVEYICILKMTFSNFQTGLVTKHQEKSSPLKILEAFTKILVLDYEINEVNNFKHFIEKYSEGRIEEMNVDSSVSDVELSAEYKDFYENS